MHTTLVKPPAAAACVPVAMVSIWVAYYSHNLKTRALVQTNDPHVAEILEPEHVHA